jgi:hypothetical protein
MLQTSGEFRPDTSSFHGTLMSRGQVWEVCFVDVLRERLDWLVECVVVGPTVHHVTIRCAAQVGPGETARRIMATLRDWLATGDLQRRAHIAVPQSYTEVC